MSNQLAGSYKCLNPECGSSDARRKYKDGSSFCFSCRKKFKSDEDDGSEPVTDVSTPVFRRKTVAEQLEEIKTLQMRGFRDWNITKDICEFYKVKTEYTTDTGVAKCHYYPYESGKAYKVRKLPKEFTWIGTSDEMFGRELFSGGGKRLIICEGEKDTLAMAKISFDRYKKMYPVVGLSSSAMTKSALKHRDWIRSFSEVILMMDEDEAGYKARDELTRIIGLDKVKITKLPSNDIHETYITQGPEAVLSAVFEAHHVVPSGIITTEDLWKQVEEYTLLPSVPYPECLKGINAKAKGARLGEIALFVSGTSCLAPDTQVLMFNGSLKQIGDIELGEQVMGDDGSPRIVLDKFEGDDFMYRVFHSDGTSFTCNSNHILSVVNNDTEGRWGLKKDQIVDVPISEYLGWSDKRKHLSKSFKAECLEFGNSVETSALQIHPYILGAWLGDGYSADGRLSAEEASIEILEKIQRLGQAVTKQSTELAWGLSGLKVKLRELGLLNNKHIPESYLRSSVEARFELLAGMLDTDGYAVTDGRFEFSQKSERITNDFCRLVRSLGLRASVSKQVNNKYGNCFRVFVSGATHLIPNALTRKQQPAKEYRTNQLRSATHIEPAGFNSYVGISLDRDQRFVLGNFTVTHNCGKSTLMREIMLNFKNVTEDKIGVVSLEEAPAETARKLAGMQLLRNPANEEIPLDELKVGFDEVFGDDKFIVLDHQGSLKDESILDKLEYMALSGCKYIVIDHITILVSEGAGDLQGNEAIDKVMNDLLRFTKRHNVWVGLVSHLRKAPSGGKSFEQGIMPNLDDIKGSGSIKQVSFDIFAFARNLTEPDEIKRNTIQMSVLKCRYSGLTGPVEGAYYHFPEGRFRTLDRIPGFVPNRDLSDPVKAVQENIKESNDAAF